jgi:hypothetical protein
MIAELISSYFLMGSAPTFSTLVSYTSKAFEVKERRASTAMVI